MDLFFFSVFNFYTEVNWKSFFFVFDFKDPATLYIESLISVHNNVMWYLVLIIVIVYWTLYKIIKDSDWSTFNKRSGFLRIIYSNSIFAKLLTLIVVILSSAYKVILFVCWEIIRDAKQANYLLNSTKNIDLFLQAALWGFHDGRTCFKRIPFWLGKHKYFPAAQLVRSKFLDQLLFSKATSGYFYFDNVTTANNRSVRRYNSFLTVQQFKHSTLLEIVWATFPSVIILLILVPSVLLIYSIDEDLDPELTIKVVGHQWFWSYESDGWIPVQYPMSFLQGRYPYGPGINLLEMFDAVSYSSFEFDSCMVITDSLSLGEKRLLEVDNPLIVPCGVGIRFLITSTDVLHAWAIPELGIKVDAVPGRLSQFVSMLRRPGVFYGQCSEICGVAHAFMPIVVEGHSYLDALHLWTTWDFDM